MRFVWNISQTGLVNLDKVRNFELVRDTYGIGVIAWISDSESVHLGRFDNEKKAMDFLDAIVKENGKHEK